MDKFSFPTSFAYRHRYLLGYSFVALALIATVLFAVLFLPGGITADEIQAITISGNLNFGDLASLNVVNLPYYLLQKASLALFGVSIFTIKLPSVILAVLSAIGLVLLLKRWFKSSIAVLASLIAITTGQFIFIAQNGTPEILFIFWSVWLLLLASLLAFSNKHQVLYGTLFCVLASLSLYTPLSFYGLALLATAVVFHPHLRHIFKKLPKTKLLPGVLLGILLFAPLVIYIIKDLGVLSTLLGWPTSIPDFKANLISLFYQYLNFANPGGSVSLTPFFGLGSFLLIVLGAYRIIQTRATAKSYLAILWSVCLVLLLILNPNYTNFSFLPLTILLAAGINWLLTYWYNLFPRNPYARIGGLIPIVILVVALVFSGLNRYVYSYHYDSNITYSFSRDITLIPSNTKEVVVSENELDFYKILEKYNHQFAVSLKPNSNQFLATRQATSQISSNYKIQRIITNSQSKDADRFYQYTNR